MPIRKVEGGFKWGGHGAVFPSKAGAERQAAAAYAHGYKGDAAVQGAGLLFVTPEGLALFLKRAPGADHGGEWDLPGGGAEPGERPYDTARRECAEETGDVPEAAADPEVLSDFLNDEDGVRFVTFLHPVAEHFAPELNAEHTKYAWAPLDWPPEPLHPGVRRTLEALLDPEEAPAMDEAFLIVYKERLEIAK